MVTTNEIIAAANSQLLIRGNLLAFYRDTVVANLLATSSRLLAGFFYTGITSAQIKESFPGVLDDVDPSTIRTRLTRQFKLKAHW